MHLVVSLSLHHTFPSPICHANISLPGLHLWSIWAYSNNLQKKKNQTTGRCIPCQEKEETKNNIRCRNTLNADISDPPQKLQFVPFSNISAHKLRLRARANTKVKPPSLATTACIEVSLQSEPSVLCSQRAAGWWAQNARSVSATSFSGGLRLAGGRVRWW